MTEDRKNGGITSTLQVTDELMTQLIQQIELLSSELYPIRKEVPATSEAGEKAHDPQQPIVSELERRIRAFNNTLSSILTNLSRIREEIDL